MEYIDFGNDEILPVKEVRTMQKQFMKHPAFSLHCSLFDIAPHKEDQPWSVESIQEFHQMTQNQVIIAGECAYDVALILWHTITRNNIGVWCRIVLI